MRLVHYVAAIFALTAFGNASAQTTDPVIRVFHASGPALSYEVATIKLSDPDAGGGSGRMVQFGQTIRDYIRSAYAPTFVPLAKAQVVGGPAWLDKDRYSINGKPPAELEAAMRTMKTADQVQQTHRMSQSLLAERFQLVIHFEVREIPIYELVPAKGGLKIAAVAPPPAREPGGPLPPPPVRGAPLPPGMMMTMLSNTGIRTTNAKSTTITGLIRLLSDQLGDTGDRPILDNTGFTGNFDIDGLEWAPLGRADADTSIDAPSITTALEEKLGLKLVATKGPVEMVVIDHIDLPSPN
jgi:uncharacterized protein (TIGR03435 family)